MKPYYLIFNTQNKFISGLDLTRSYNDFVDLEINLNLKESIKQRIYAEQDFELTVQELQQVVVSLDKRIKDLLKHPDFNPFKEELREKFPNQYGSQPFEFKGVTYYLYHKGKEFYVDSLIYGVIGFKKIIKDYVSANKPLKYIYKN